ncbi:MAG: hypothetical protein K2L77_05995 [Muribaculaceae bacterium]|nr:hypothetical protein [Muribaculaceae bacterium]
MNTLTQTIGISKETVAEMPVVDYPGQITLVDTPEMARIALRELTRARVVGFDTETRPSFHRGRVHNVALMQLSTDDHCYLFRLNIIGISGPLRKFLEDPEIIKIGLSVHDDFSVMRRMVDDLDPQGFIDLQEYVKFFHINDISLQKIYAIVFREKISKNQRLTNWEAPELTEQQQRYAAIDAWACLRLYRTFRSGNFHPDESPFIVDRSLLCPSMNNQLVGPAEAARHAEAMQAAEEKRRAEAELRQSASTDTDRSARKRASRSKEARKARSRKSGSSKSTKSSRTTKSPSSDK